MIEVKGAFNSAIVYSSHIDELSEIIIKMVCASPLHSSAKIRVMPDVSRCRGCVIGMAMTIKEAVVPGHVGKDGRCGLLVQNLGNREIDYDFLDRILFDRVIYRDKNDTHAFFHEVPLHKLVCYKSLDIPKIQAAFCRIGHGNHFVEIDVNNDGEYFLVIHSGSSELGYEVLTHYQKRAFAYVNQTRNSRIIEIKKLYRDALHPLLFDDLDLASFNAGELPIWYCWLEDQDLVDFLHDIEIVQTYARLNREAIALEIVDALKLPKNQGFHCGHNYIDTQHGILHKGSVSAQLGEKVIIPVNMKVGSMLCTGKGNPNYNYSAPHGVGKKTVATELDIQTYISDMRGIHSATISEKTLDESPRAYKDIDSVMDDILQTVVVDEIIRPTYNLKDSKK